MQIERRKPVGAGYLAVALVLSVWTLYSEITGEFYSYDRYRHIPAPVFQSEDPDAFRLLGRFFWSVVVGLVFRGCFRVPLLEKLASKLDHLLRKPNKELNWWLIIGVLVAFAVAMVGLAAIIP